MESPVFLLVDDLHNNQLIAYNLVVETAYSFSLYIDIQHIAKLKWLKKVVWI